MKPRTRHKRRLVRYRRRNLTVFGTFKFPDGHYSYQLAKHNYNYVLADSLSTLWQRGYAEITLQYWRESDRRIRAGYKGLSVELGKVLDAEAGLREALATATPRVNGLVEALEQPIPGVDNQHRVVIGYNFEAADRVRDELRREEVSIGLEYHTHLDELENPRIEGYYFEHTFDIEDPEAVMILDLYEEDTD
jgi:hypothetical protein